MKVLNLKSLGTALGAGLFATVALLPQAKGELVYENGAPAANNAAANAQVDDRSTMRQALGASEKVQVTLQTQQAAPAPTDVVTPAPVATAAAAPIETENLSKADLMRRERQREELKNEDILQERLEELRLRDERRRTQEVLTTGAATGAVTPTDAASAAASAGMKEEVIVAPVTDHPGKPALAPSMAPAAAAPVAPMAQDSGMMGTSVATAPSADSYGEHTNFSIGPRAGISNMIGDSGYFNVTPHYALGLAADVSASDYLSFNVGYTFSQYGVSMASSNPYVIWAQQQAAMLGQGNFQSLNMNQNVFDAGIKLHLLGPDSRIRPFIGGGGAYAMNYINFSSQILAEMGPNMSPDYKVNDFLGYLSTGADFKISKNISVGAEFRYYAVLSYSQSSSLNSYYGAFYGNPYYGGVNPYNQDTAVAGGSLGQNSFYSILGNASFSF